MATDSLAGYEALALSLAREPARLAEVKRRLAANLPTRPLFDTRRFARHIEAAYTTMVGRARRAEPPASFAVAPMA